MTGGWFMTLFYSHPIRFWGPICHTLWFLLKQQHDATNACADMPLRFETDEAIELISSPMGKQDMSATANTAVFVLKPFFPRKSEKQICLTVVSHGRKIYQSVTDRKTIMNYAM